MAKVQKDALKAILKKITSKDNFSKLVGTELVELQPGFARATLEITEHIMNVHNMAHGGAIFTLAHLVCEAAGNSFGEPAKALQTNIHFLAAGRSGDLLTATAELASRTKSFGVMEFKVSNQEERVLSKGQQIIIFEKQKEKFS